MLRAILVILTLFLMACGSEDDGLATSTEQLMFEAGQGASKASNFQRSIEVFQQLEARYPFGDYAAQAQLELIYSYYRNFEPEAARAAADRFIRLHPDDENLDYAYYMKGQVYYSEDSSMLDRFLPIDPSKRDPGKARESFADFSQLLSRYPESIYAADARAKMIYLRNLLAAYEINVARFYVSRAAYVSALNRARYVVENYQGTPAVPDAMAIMVETYLRLGLNDLADTSLAILKDNYADHPSLDDNGDFLIMAEITDPSLLYTVSFGLLGSNQQEVSLAPVKRPARANSLESIELPKPESRSLLNRITFGMLGK